MDDEHGAAAEPAAPEPSGDGVAAAATEARIASQKARAVSLVEEAALCEARIAALHAHQLSVLADLQVDPYVDSHGVDLVDELAPRLRWTVFTADRRLSTAARVAECFPGLFADLAAGEVDYRRVDVVVAESGLLDPEQARVLDAVLAGRLAGLTTAQIKALVRREIAVIDSEAVKERARRAVSDRRVVFASLPDGEALLEVRGPAPALRGVYDRLDALAQDTARPGADVDPYAGYPVPDAGAPSGDPAAGTRGIDARRFDACVAALLAPVNGAPGAATGTGPQITIAWPAAVGADDLPAHLAGHGTIPAEMVRHLLRDTGFRKVLTHPSTGHVVAVDGHVHPAGVLPDLSTPTAAVATRGTRDDTRTASRTGTGTAVATATATFGATTAAGHTAPGAATRVTATETRTTAADHDPTPDPDGDRPSGPVADLVREPLSLPLPLPPPIAGTDQGVGETDQGAGEDDSSRRRPWNGDPFEVPLDVLLVGPGPGWDEGLGGYDDGTDPVHVTGPDPTDLDGYVHSVLGATAATAGATPPATCGARGPDGAAEQRIDPAADAEPHDPALGPRDAEFDVTLAITTTRPSTLLDAHRIHDGTAWAHHARVRTRAALATCPAASDPARPYRFPAALRRFLVHRSPTCTAPGCRAPARRCDLDHTHDHAAGGPTCPCNATPLCRRHHTAKHRRGWLATRTTADPRDPSLTWLSPLGYLYTVPAAPLFTPVPVLVAAHLVERHRATAALRAATAARPAPPETTPSEDGSGDGDGDGRGDGHREEQAQGQGRGRADAGTRRPVPQVAPHSVEHVWSEDCRTCDPPPTGRILPGGTPGPVRAALLQDLLDGILPPPVDPDADPPF